MRTAITEAIGTFFWVFAVIAAVSRNGPFAAFAIGATVAAAIAAGRRFSAAHYNPASSIAAFVGGRVSAADLPTYIGGQLAGASLASLVGAWVFRLAGPGAHGWSGRALATAIVVEFLFTFLVVFAALNVPSSYSSTDAVAGLAVGAAVTAGFLIAGPFSGGVFNPAVALGLDFARLSPWANLWAYVAPQLAAGILAGLASRALVGRST